MSTETAARPARFADYVLSRFLGDGVNGRVFVAKPPARLVGSPDSVALKVLREGTERARFRAAAEELQCVRCLQSPHIVNLFEAGRGGDGTMYCAMELARGGSLAAPVRNLRREDVLRAVAGAARGTHALHEAGVVHRAIRPSNILLTDGGGKVAEPELTHLLWPGRSFHAQYSPSQIQYLDPVLIRGDAPSRAADIWGLGATLHVALTGRPIYYSHPSDLLGTLRTALTGAPVIDWSVAPSDGDLIRACLSADPGDRPGSALEVAQQIERILGIDGVATHPPVDSMPNLQAAPTLENPNGYEVVSLWTVETPAPRDVAARARRMQNSPLVEGILCKRGHINYPDASYCVSCGVSLLQASRRRVRRPRPPLGILILDNGDICTLDADHVIGREPSRDPAVQEGIARPLRLDDRQHRVSAVHADIRLDGWRVLLTDRGSANGTFIRPTHRDEWTRLGADPVDLRSRTTVRVGDREFVFTSNRER